MTAHPNRKMITVGACGNYRNAETTVRAKRLSSGALWLSRRQVRGANDRCAYAGEDYAIFYRVDGYNDWDYYNDGYEQGMIAWPQ